MNVEEKLHPGHRSIRLKGRDYSAPGVYFVTICTHDRNFIFGKVDRERIEVSLLGKIVHETWISIPLHFAQVNLHGFVIMPNHVHGLVEIVSQAGAQRAAPLQGTAASDSAGPGVRPRSLAAIVRSFKAAVTLRARREMRWTGDIWQRNYFERVVRNGQEFADASRYIEENPMRWEFDHENPKRKQTLATEVKGAQRAAPLQGRGSR